jgi:hypothetical protein
MKIGDVINHVHKLAVLARGPEAAGDLEIEDLVRWTVDRLGLAVDVRTGDVYDPTPAPAIVPRDERGVRWPGSGRARRRR